jgi:hypothetical protein
MSYATVLTGLHVRFATVTGIANILKYVPTSIGDLPTLYSVIERVEITRSGQVRATHYRIMHRMLFRWQDYEQAEIEILPFVDSIPLCVEADPHLGGVIVSGFAEINEMTAGWVDIAGNTYRTLDFISDVTVKR